MAFIVTLTVVLLILPFITAWATWGRVIRSWKKKRNTNLKKDMTVNEMTELKPSDGSLLTDWFIMMQRPHFPGEDFYVMRFGNNKEKKKVAPPVTVVYEEKKDNTLHFGKLIEVISFYPEWEKIYEKRHMHITALKSDFIRDAEESFHELYGENVPANELPLLLLEVGEWPHTTYIVKPMWTLFGHVYGKSTK